MALQCMKEDNYYRSKPNTAMQDNFGLCICFVRKYHLDTTAFM
jgi:hypothetical protein